MFAATPVLLDGCKGTRVFAVSADVQAGAPTAQIEGFVGELQEGSAVEAVVQYSGGTQGACTMQWYIYSVPESIYQTTSVYIKLHQTTSVYNIKPQ